MSGLRTPAPVTAAEFAAALAPLAPAGPLAVAVSGGSDSLALLWLARAWAAAEGRIVHAVTVDHGLRAESAVEARGVAERCAAWGVPHSLLTWDGPKPTANLQAAARDARYRLMSDWAHHNALAGLLLAHTLDDQAETFLLRLARGSGVDGLAAMAPCATAHGLLLVRPLLAVARLRLRATLTAAGLPWVDDPANTDPRFARARLRAVLPVLAAEGLTAPRLAGTASRMARVRAALESATTRVLAEAAEVNDAGFVRFALAPLAGAPEEIGLRALAKALRAVGGAEEPLRLKSLERLFSILIEEKLGRGRTLGGCRIVPAAGGRAVILVRETAQITPEPLSLAPGRTALWDGRFEVGLAATGPLGASVRRLGAEGFAQVRARWIAAAPVGAGLPALVRPSLPSLWVAGRPAAVPHLAFADSGLGLAPRNFQARFTGL